MAEKISGQDSREEYKKVALAAGILFAFLIGLAFYLNIPLATGRAVILKTLPVDPFDPLRGQFMAIRYEIGSVPMLKGIQEGDRVFITLKENENKTWDYLSASMQKPSEGMFIKGEIESIRKKEMQVRYGIEQYFFERGGQIPTQNITVEVKVDNSGKARIVQLLQNNKPIEVEYRKPSLIS